MRYVNDLENGEEYIETGIVDLDNIPVNISNSNGYGGCNIQVGEHILTWKELDHLKSCIEAAEAKWRNE